MGLEEIHSDSTLVEKKTFSSGCSTSMVGTWGLQKTQSALDPHRKKNIYFRFRLQYYDDAWDLKKTNLTRFSLKKNIFASNYSSTVVYMT